MVFEQYCRSLGIGRSRSAYLALPNAKYGEAAGITPICERAATP